MANTTITKILMRRGPEVDRENIVPTMGEPLFTTDTHRFYIGDGETSGGQPVLDIDPAYFAYKRVDSNTGEIKDLPPGNDNGTDHHVISFNPNQTGDVKTSGRIITTNTGSGCDPDTAALVSMGGIYAGDNINCGKDVISFCTSDAKFKDNIKPIHNSLKKLECINGVTFNWNNKQDTYTGQDTGVIAQDVQSAELPGVVDEREDGTLAVKYEKIVPLLVECIKDLSNRVKQLEDQIHGPRE